MKQNTLETLVGFIIISVAGFFLMYAYSMDGSANGASGYYGLRATFQSAEGIKEGTDIMVAGIKVGKVDDMSLDQVHYTAKVRLSIANEVKLPKDSQALIVTNGFLGGKFISISPGADQEVLRPNDEIKHTQSAMNLESLISKFLSYQSASKK